MAMMSAPSSASRTAWLRPCPRPAPVMNATLPSTRPATSAYVPVAGPCGHDGLLARRSTRGMIMTLSANYKGAPPSGGRAGSAVIRATSASGSGAVMTSRSNA